MPDLVLDILAAALCVVGIVTCGFLISMIRDVRRVTNETSMTISAVLDEIKDFRQKTSPTLGYLEEASKHSVGITKKVEEQLDDTGKIVQEIAGVTRRIAELEKFVSEQIIRPLNTVSDVIKGLRKVLGTGSKTKQQNLDRHK